VVLSKSGAGRFLVAGPRNRNGSIMQSVEIKRNTIAGGQRVTVGEVVELADNDARELIAMGKAVPVADAPVPDHREKDAEKKVSKRAAPKRTRRSHKKKDD
jgi:hypothetical protein